MGHKRNSGSVPSASLLPWAIVEGRCPFFLTKAALRGSAVKPRGQPGDVAGVLTLWNMSHRYDPIQMYALFCAELSEVVC